MTSDDPNYRYWQEHGGVWAHEYQDRKQRFPLYHIQEIMLAEYMSAHADLDRPIKVIEFGCGVGRHLRNLIHIPGIDVYGFDQSPTMLSGCKAWADEAWFDSHITLGAPVGRLPFPDGSFDIVYSTEVLVHVRPEHLSGILSELLRISKGHVLHLEPAPGVKIHSDVHSGCWGHDLPAAYESLGFNCEVFAGGYGAHAPYRVVKGDKPRYTWEPWRLEMYRTCERMLTAGFDFADSARRVSEEAKNTSQLECDMLRKSLAESQVREAAMNEQIGSLTSQCDSARIEFDRVREESMIELSACRTDAAVRAEEAERRRVSELELARQNAQTEMETAQKAWEDRLARFESLLAQARSRMEELEADNSALRRDLMTAHLMREDLSLKVVSQQARIDELADTLRKLYLNHELFTASVKSIVDP